MKNNKLSIFAGTALDRFLGFTDKLAKSPSSNRRLCETAIIAVSKLTDKQLDEVKTVYNEFDANEFIEVILEKTSVNMPRKRFDQIKNVIREPEWLDILKSIYVLVRLVKPKVVIETGIGEVGLSSNFILKGLKDNDSGHLFSIDPDKFYDLYGYHVGTGILDYLKDKHTFVKGYSQDVLNSVVAASYGELDIFLHDGDHKFKTKLFEYNTVFPNLRKGGFILSDDTWDSAFDRFIEEKEINSCSLKYGKGDYFSFAKK